MVEVTPGIYVVRAFQAREAAEILGRASASRSWREDGETDALFEEDEPELLGSIRERVFAATSRIAASTAPKTVPAEIQIVRYRTGGSFIDHRDTPVPGAKPRALSVVCYLNDDFIGGATAFPEREFVFQPWCGMAVVFPHAMPHRSEPVLEGTKYAIAAWYHAAPERRTLAAEMQTEHELWESVLAKEHGGHQAVGKHRT